MKEINDIRDLTEAVKVTLRAAGFSEAGKYTGFRIEPINHGTQLRVSVRVGRTGNTTPELEHIVSRYRQALVYADRFEVYDSEGSGQLVKSLIVEAPQAEPQTAPVQYTLHEVRGQNALTVKIEGEPVGTMLYSETPQHTGWTFANDPSRTYWQARETAAAAMILLRNLRQVLKHHVDEEGVYENALLTALAALRSYPEREAASGRPAGREIHRGRRKSHNF